jgi:hypothetical protein
MSLTTNNYSQQVSQSNSMNRPEKFDLPSTIPDSMEKELQKSHAAFQEFLKEHLPQDTVSKTITSVLQNSKDATFDTSKLFIEEFLEKAVKEKSEALSIIWREMTDILDEIEEFKFIQSPNDIPEAFKKVSDPLFKKQLNNSELEEICKLIQETIFVCVLSNEEFINQLPQNSCYKDAKELPEVKEYLHDLSETKKNQAIEAIRKALLPRVVELTKSFHRFIDETSGDLLKKPTYLLPVTTKAYEFQEAQYWKNEVGHHPVTHEPITGSKPAPQVTLEMIFFMKRIILEGNLTPQDKVLLSKSNHDALASVDYVRSMVKYQKDTEEKLHSAIQKLDIHTDKKSEKIEECKKHLKNIFAKEMDVAGQKALKIYMEYVATQVKVGELLNNAIQDKQDPTFKEVTDILRIYQCFIDKNVPHIQGFISPKATVLTSKPNQ